MRKLERIFPECCADTLLVQLIFKRGRPFHYKGISKVAAALKEFNNDTLFVVGVIDDDKFENVPLYFNDFEIEHKITDENIIILKKKNTKKHVIRIAPAFEKWIWNVAVGCEIDPSAFGFKTWKDLKEITKSEVVFNDKDFKKFLNAVIDKDPPAIQTLRHWLIKAISDDEPA